MAFILLIISSRERVLRIDVNQRINKIKMIDVYRDLKGSKSFEARGNCWFTRLQKWSI